MTDKTLKTPPPFRTQLGAELPDPSILDCTIFHLLEGRSEKFLLYLPPALLHSLATKTMYLLL